MTTTQTTRPDLAEVDSDGTDSRPTAAATSETTPTQDREPDGEALPLDLVFESLKNSRRRQVLRYLQDEDGPASVSDLAEHVAAIENDTTVEALSSQQRKRVYVGLYQCHLPKLDDAGVIEYDDDRGMIELGPNATQLERYLDVADGTDGDDDRPWPQYYLGLAVASVGALVLAAIVFGGSLGVASVTVGLGLAVGLASLSLTHARTTA